MRYWTARGYKSCSQNNYAYSETIHVTQEIEEVDLEKMKLIYMLWKALSLLISADEEDSRETSMNNFANATFKLQLLPSDPAKLNSSSGK